MMESRQIVRLWQQAGAEVLVTLVRAEGSSYRRPGARLLLSIGGEHAGTISGGCLESEILRKAKWLVREGAAVERYSTMFDDTAEVPFGLGCGGVVDHFGGCVYTQYDREGLFWEYQCPDGESRGHQAE